MKRKTKWSLAGAVVLAGCAGAAAWMLEPAIAPIAPPAAASFAAQTVARGARVVAQGDCMVCHTASGGEPFAGGLPLKTPFGTIYTTNITPDAGTGIGNWSPAAFTRALRRGVARDGHLLYPAFPYIHYTRMSNQDIEDAYAYLMTRAPVQATPPANQLIFPLNFRPLLAGWNLLYLRPGPVPADGNRSEIWNRGRYLVDGAGHCASCHSALGPIGGERSPAFSGGNIDGWDAPALTALLQAPRPWTEQQLALYLRHGWSPEHGAAGGPMAPVAHSLSTTPPEDAAAIAHYIMSLQNPAAKPPALSAAAVIKPAANDPALLPGRTLFAGACAGCHTGAAPMMAAGSRPSLALSSAVAGPKPDNLIQTILNGLPWTHTGQSSYMPPFAGTLTDAQVASIAMYVRAEIGQRAPWQDDKQRPLDARGIEQRVTAIRKENQQ
ncbi:c-type cytochrome [Duganella phyllosphaerae]|uniref:Nicotinate dehydrogenase subunit B n=1 Tax=Duganella phyllosphaerae TaxID=762836 RepID=A0A1E7X825_9BURK|nr:c-type cytochrome [Duganella phyllosphaerae]OFA09287.1 nicotinate dehydrogenase subunit B [Duganella phyllosphaerae]